MRHTFASWAIAAGLPTFEIAATMGTSLEQLSKIYAHLLPDSADRARVALDAFLAHTDAECVAWLRTPMSSRVTVLNDSPASFPKQEADAKRLGTERAPSAGFSHWRDAANPHESSIGAPRFELGTSSPPD